MINKGKIVRILLVSGLLLYSTIFCIESEEERNYAKENSMSMETSTFKESNESVVLEE